MLFSAFALAVDRFVTIGRRTAQFCFGLLMRCLFLTSPSLRPSRLLTHATKRALYTLAGTWEQIRTKILRAFGGMMAGPLVAKKKKLRFLSALQLISKHRHREAEGKTVCPERMD